MSDEEGFYNVHVHLLTTRNTPRYFPHWALVPFTIFPILIRLISWVFALLPWQWLADTLERIVKFHHTGNRTNQRAVMRDLMHYYPRSTKFVVLPLDMEKIAHGPVWDGIGRQHDELAELASSQDYGDQIVPFATLDPNRDDGFAEFRRAIEELDFKGLKIYPRMGYAPTHDVLMNQVYPYCVERNLPVMTHCSDGGVRHGHRWTWTKQRLREVTEPDAYLPVLDAFPDLRICLAHFGGDKAWNDWLRNGFDPEDDGAKGRNWASRIVQLINEERHENLYTDISYTIFKFERNTPLLQLLLRSQGKPLRRRVLYGSDFYMTRQEELSEKSVSIRLRNALGEEDFKQIAVTNPKEWLYGRSLGAT